MVGVPDREGGVTDNDRAEPAQSDAKSDSSDRPVERPNPTRRVIESEKPKR